MALPPAYASHALHLPSSTGEPAQPHTLEVYLDYVCPFSAKFFNNFFTTYLPQHQPGPTPLTIIFRHQIQPWHPSSTLTHEAALAVERLHPDSFWKFSRKLMEAQTEFFDLSVRDETREQTYARLAKLAAGVEGAQINAEGIEGLLRLKKGEGVGALNVGNEVTDALKWHIKFARVCGVHVSPTVYWDGIKRDDISSSWAVKEWREFFGKELAQ